MSRAGFTKVAISSSVCRLSAGATVSGAGKYGDGEPYGLKVGMTCKTVSSARNCRASAIACLSARIENTE
jgi:hypothetical protein